MKGLAKEYTCITVWCWPEGGSGEGARAEWKWAKEGRGEKGYL